MKTWQKLAITAGVILVAFTIFTSIAGDGEQIIQTIITWVFQDLFGLPSAPQIF